ncbi:MAG: M23 family metallopeptidase [Cyanobacteria bacterium J06635_15]
MRVRLSIPIRYPSLARSLTIAASSMICFGVVQPSVMALMLTPTSPIGTKQTPETPAESRDNQGTQLCRDPALERVRQHTVAEGETLDAIAQQYRLIPATLLGFNPALQQRQIQVGDRLEIPPFNGIRVQVPSGQTWVQVAEAYGIGADVLFEVNGCVATVPANIFVPGVNWFPGVATTSTAATAPTDHGLNGYPLPERAPIILGYGWQPDPTGNQPIFSSGVALGAIANISVLAVGDGVVAFAGAQPDDSSRNLVVINHDQGIQTRYANLGEVNVSVGQRVSQGTQLGRLGEANQGSNRQRSALYFEVRTNSELGWVAQNPQRYIPELGLR